MIDWKHTYAAIWRPNASKLHPVKSIDPISLNDLVGIKRQKDELLANTDALIANKPSNHALLWGSRGTGKSSLIKAVFNARKDQGLRLVEFSKEDLIALPELIDDLRDLPYAFIVYCDDLSFEDGDNSYKGLKPILEGSIELPPANIRTYATSNRRHMVQESMQDNETVQVAQGELHYGDSIEEKISLSDRFGLWLSFYQGSYEEYLKMVDHYFENITCDVEALHVEAKRFASYRASRSGRTAKQFFNHYMQVLEKQ